MADHDFDVPYYSEEDEETALDRFPDDELTLDTVSETNLGKVEEGGGPSDEDNLEDYSEDEESIDEEHNDKISKIIKEMPKAPNAYAAEKMVETFKDIYTVVSEMSTLANVVIQEVRKLYKTSDIKNKEINNTIEHYQEISKKIHSAITETHKFFDNNLDITHELSTLKKDLVGSFKLLIEELSSLKEEYKETVNYSTMSLTNKMDKIAQEIDITPLALKIEDEIKKTIKDSTIQSLEKNLALLNDVFSEFAHVTNMLKGDKHHEGLFESLAEDMESFEKISTSLKRGVQKSLIVAFSVTALVIGLASGYFIASQKYESNFTAKIVEESQRIHAIYQSKLDSEQAYEEWKLKNNIANNQKFGFSRFSNSKKPYFYFPANAKTYTNNNQILVVLGENN